MSASDHNRIEPTCDNTSAKDIELYACVPLRDGWCAPLPLFKTILERIREVIDGMEPGVLYTLEELVDPEYWQTLSRGDRRTAGRCGPEMIMAGLLPEIEIGECKRTRRLRYRLVIR